jgi:hypothetical protein
MQNVLGILKNTDISRKNAKDNSEKPSGTIYITSLVKVLKTKTQNHSGIT